MKGSTSNFTDCVGYCRLTMRTSALHFENTEGCHDHEGGADNRWLNLQVYRFSVNMLYKIHRKAVSPETLDLKQVIIVHIVVLEVLSFHS